MPPKAAMARPRSPPGKAAPDLGAGHVGAQVVHVDAVLRQQGQHVLAGLHQLRRLTVAQGLAQGGEAGLVLGGFGEVHRADEILARQGRCHLLGRGAKGQGGLILGPVPGGGFGFRGRSGDRLRAGRGELGQRGFRLARARRRSRPACARPRVPRSAPGPATAPHRPAGSRRWRLAGAGFPRASRGWRGLRWPRPRSSPRA